jgi:hypothetical protein
MNDELDNALEWADEASEYTNPRITEIGEDGYLATLADAVRSLRETVKAREEEIARLKSQLDDIGKWHAVNPSLDDALNSGDGSYRP